jgi:hypothetical protein
MRITTPNENTNWREILRQVCRWALPQSADAERRRNLQRTLANLHTMDQMTCEVVATEWLDELADEQLMH